MSPEGAVCNLINVLKDRLHSKMCAIFWLIRQSLGPFWRPFLTEFYVNSIGPGECPKCKCKHAVLFIGLQFCPSVCVSLQPVCGSAVWVWSGQTTPVSVCPGDQCLLSMGIVLSSSLSKVICCKICSNWPLWVTTVNVPIGVYVSCLCVHCVQTSKQRKRLWMSPAAVTASLIWSKRLCIASACTHFSAQQRALLSPFSIQQVWSDHSYSVWDVEVSRLTGKANIYFYVHFLMR